MIGRGFDFAACCSTPSRTVDGNLWLVLLLREIGPFACSVTPLCYENDFRFRCRFYATLLKMLMEQ
jgi:hypothetical protein